VDRPPAHDLSHGRAQLRLAVIGDALGLEPLAVLGDEANRAEVAEGVPEATGHGVEQVIEVVRGHRKLARRVGEGLQAIGEASALGQLALGGGRADGQVVEQDVEGDREPRSGVVELRGLVQGHPRRHVTDRRRGHHGKDLVEARGGHHGAMPFATSQACAGPSPANTFPRTLALARKMAHIAPDP
jgi:hypothetical protein